MSTPTPRVRAPASAKVNEIVEIKTLISHDMENGQRKDAEGKLVPRRIINRFEARYNGRLVFAADWHPSISPNPYQSFFLKVTESGDLDIAWTDDDGGVYKATAHIAAA